MYSRIIETKANDIKNNPRFNSGCPKDQLTKLVLGPHTIREGILPILVCLK